MIGFHFNDEEKSLSKARALVSCRPDQFNQRRRLGVVAAILDCYLFERSGVLELFAGFPEDREIFCRNIAVPGGLRFSGDRKEFSFTALRDAAVTFRFPAGEWRDADGNVFSANDVKTVTLAAGKCAHFTRLN